MSLSIKKPKRQKRDDEIWRDKMEELVPGFGERVKSASIDEEKSKKKYKKKAWKKLSFNLAFLSYYKNLIHYKPIILRFIITFYF